MEQAKLARLPGEILLHILSFLSPLEITRLQLVSRLFRDLARDDGFWRSRCLDESTFLEVLDRSNRALAVVADGQPSEPLRRAAASFHGQNRAEGDSNNGDENNHGRRPADRRERERVRVMANWDPSYPSEKVSWYNEYIQRHAPIAVNWLEQPLVRDGSMTGVVEARGVALYRPEIRDEAQQPETLLAVSPLDDGSVCLWDVNGTRGKRGAIYAKSNQGILFVDGPAADNSRRSKRIDSGVIECVSIDSWRHRAFFAVQCHLIEVDLRRLSVVGCESFPWSITALSTAHRGMPLTVGTSSGIHMHDSRSRAAVRANGADCIDDFDRAGANEFYDRSLRDLFNSDELPPYASLTQPGPLSILHLPRPGAAEDVSDDIYVAGRFSNILHYDRRTFPSIMGSIHSGARLCSMTSLPYPFSTLDAELRRKGQLSLEQVERSKAKAGERTLITCGEYNTKGSLEIYGLRSPSLASPTLAGGLQSSTLKNRHTSSSSKLLSVVTHGTRLACSDGSGNLKWFERDGFTEVRRCRIGHCERDQGPSLFASMPGSDDIARKLLPTEPGSDGDRVNNNDLLFWTGEKLGLVGFSSEPAFTLDDFDQGVKTAEAIAQEHEERVYCKEMRRALERQADDVRFVRKLGLGSGARG